MGKSTETTTKFRVDISELKANIQEANRQIALANSEFKKASAGMQNWAKDADGLSAKLEQLRTVTDNYESILSELENQYSKVVEEQGENSKGATELQIKINNLKGAIQGNNAQIDRYEQALSQVNAEAEDFSNEMNDNASASDRLKATIAQQENALNELKQAYTNAALEQGETSREAKSLAAQIASLSNDLDENRSALKDAENAADSFDSSLDKVEGSAEEASGAFTVMKGALASLIADGIKAAASAFKDLMTASSEASANFQAQTGASAEEMKRFNAEITDLYKQNFGESMQDVADSMAQVKQQMGDIDPSILKDLTKNAISLRDTFGFEVNEQIRSVNMLMQQFGISGDEAFNLIVQGAQNGLDKNGDLLDSINEYSVHYKQLGFTSEEFFNSLANGTASGTFSVDKLGDAMKEFGIRTKDTTNTTTEAFEAIGLNADDMRNKFAQGGDTAKAATAETLKALYAVEDQVVQNQAGVGLFGTMWEDLGKEGVNALMNVEGQADSTNGAMQKLTEAKYSDIGSQFKEIGRTIQVDFLNPILEKVLPGVQSFIDTVKKNLPQAKQLFSDLKPVIVGVGTAIATYFVATKMIAFVGAVKSMITAFATAPTIIAGVKAAMAALNLTMAANPIGLVIAAIAGLVAAFVALWNKSEAFREFWIGLWENVKTLTGQAIDAVIQFFSELPGNIQKFISTVIKNVTTWASDMLAKAKEVGSGFLNWIVQFFTQLPGRVQTFLSNVISRVITWVTQMVTKAKEAGSKFLQNIVTFFTQLPGKVWTFLNNTIAKAITFVSNMGTKAKEAGSKFLQNIASQLSQLPSKVWAHMNGALGKAASFVTQMAQKATAAARGFVSNIKSGLASLPGQMAEVGSNIVSGIWSGISSGWEWLKGQVSSLASSLLSAAKGALGIKSPSRKFRDMVGKMIPAGIAVGIKKNAKVATSALSDLSGRLLPSAQSLMDDVNSSFGRKYSAATSKYGSTNVTFNQYNNSPKALSRVEIYRQTRNQLRFLKAGGAIS